MRSLIWQFYADLKDYRITPTPWRRAQFRARFDYIFCRHTGFVTLDRLLQRLHAKKTELLAVLDHPDIPLHTNARRTTSAAQVTKRKVSGGTRSDVGRDCRDAFLGLAKTCNKLGVAIWDYLGSRLSIPDHPTVPRLADLIFCRGLPAQLYLPAVLPLLPTRPPRPLFYRYIFNIGRKVWVKEAKRQLDDAEANKLACIATQDGCPCRSAWHVWIKAPRSG